MYKIKFEIKPGLEGFVIHNNTDTFSLKQAEELLKQFETHPYSHTIVEETPMNDLSKHVKELALEHAREEERKRVMAQLKIRALRQKIQKERECKE